MTLKIEDIEITPLELKIECFKRGLFDFITTQKGKKHEKQGVALDVLTNKGTEELLYGGAAGGAKSWTGCAWLMFTCLAYPETKWFIGRKELKRITESTLITFFKVAKEYGITDFRFNGQKNFIQFNNGSRIDLLELEYKPSDPLFERFGSTEYTGGWIEESGEIDFGAYDILKTRIGRHYNDKYDLTAKIFLTCNPKKNWLYTFFYKPFIEGKLGKLKSFVQAFVQDNPFIESDYIDRLRRTTDKAKKERLLKGNWDYDDDPDTLCDFDNILAVFENDHVKEGDAFQTIDVARLGSDKAIILVWKGWVVIDFEVYGLSLLTEIQNKINEFRLQYDIPKKNCIADQDGLGGGVVDNCGIEGFTNGAAPVKIKMIQGERKMFESPNYNNYQSQCGYYLVDKINKNQIWFKKPLKQEYKDEIIEELGQLKSYKTDDDRKVYLFPKKEIKMNIGRSPDWRDALLMRAHFDLKKRSVSINKKRLQEIIY